MEVRVAIYAHDEQSQLIYERLSQLDLDYGYDYDEAGNIRNIGSYANVGLMISYFRYEDEGWKDLLTSACGRSISYDAIGNLLNYYSGYGPEWTFTWKNGRNFASAKNEGLGVNVSYDYDSTVTVCGQAKQ